MWCCGWMYAGMWASFCDLKLLPAADLQRMRKQYANGELLISSPGAGGQCNWTAPVETNIPDSRSKTCAGTLPANTASTAAPVLHTAATEGSEKVQAGSGVEVTAQVAGGLRYLLGNQLSKIWDRDPLTISLSKDGVSFACVLAVRARCVDGAHCGGAGHEFFPGFGKGPGYQVGVSVPEAKLPN